MGSPSLRVAVVGGGGLIGERHCQHVQNNNRTVLSAIIDPGADAAELARSLGTSLYVSVEELLDSPHKPDAAIICTPNHTHVSVGTLLTSAGVHILCEKPIATDSVSAAQLVAAAKQNSVHLLVGHHRRFNPYMLALKKIIADGRLGRVIAVNGLWTTVKPPDYFTGANAWRSRKSVGGVVLINLIHDVDLMHYLFGPIISVQAQKSISQRSEDQNAVEEGAAIIFKFECGVVGTFIISDNVVSPHSFEQGTGENPNLPQSGADVYRVFGNRGTLSFPDMTFSRYENSTPSWNETLTTTRLEVDNATSAPLALQLEHFVDVCYGAAPPSCPGREGMRALAVCEAVRIALDQSNESKEVQVQLIPE